MIVRDLIHDKERNADSDYKTDRHLFTAVSPTGERQLGCLIGLQMPSSQTEAGEFMDWQVVSPYSTPAEIAELGRK